MLDSGNTWDFLYLLPGDWYESSLSNIHIFIQALGVFFLE